MNTAILKINFRKDRPSPPPSPIRWERESRSLGSDVRESWLAMDASGLPAMNTRCPLSHRMGEGQGEGISAIILKTHSSQTLLLLSALILTTSALAQDHGHLNIGAVSTNQDS